MKRLKNKNVALQLGLFLLALLGAASIVGFFMGDAPELNLKNALQKPSATHWFGCDAFGLDLGHQVLRGARRSLSIALLVTTLNMSIGLIVGTTSALTNRWVQHLLSRLIDCFMAFPGLLLAILLASIMPHSERTVIIALTITGWTSRARFCRALVQNTAQKPFIEAALASGASPLRVVRSHIWPSMLGALTIQSTLSMGSVILGEASLSFLGLGGATSNLSWGFLIAEGREYLVEAPHLSLLPGICFIVTILTFNLLAEGLRHRLNSSQGTF